MARRPLLLDALLLPCAVVLGAPEAALALQLSVVELARNEQSGESLAFPWLRETPDVFYDDSSGKKVEKRSELSVHEAPGPALPDAVGATSTLTARYAAVYTTDGDALGVPPTDFHSHWRLVFAVDACAGCAWTATIESWWRGSQTFIDDDVADMGASTQPWTPGFGVDGTAIPVVGGTPPIIGGGTSTRDFPFYETLPTVVLTGVGPSLHHVDIYDRVTLKSSRTAGFLPVAADEVSIRSGLAGTLPGVSADDYPGLGDRDPALDGRFVRVTVVLTAVPEPRAAALLGAGLLLLAGRSRRLPCA